MAMTNHERVGKALELLKQGLGPFVEREFKSAFQDKAQAEMGRYLGDDRLNAKRPVAEWDASALIKIMWDAWNEVFRRTLGYAERSLVSEIRDWRNKWAHQETFSSDDADRALDSIERLLAAVSAGQSDEVRRLKQELRRLVADEQARGERRKSAGIAIEGHAAAHLKPWREVITPHADVASGRYQQAEFAADLWQVYLGEGGPEYRNPSEFFRRTFLTRSLYKLLVGAMERISGKGGDPVVQLQTNFGGGKTHSMLALFHLFSGASAKELPGIDEAMQDAGISSLPRANRVVLVGNKISPGNPVTKEDGTVVQTLWGELAWQLGGRKAFAKIQKDDERATSPGDRLRELFNEYAPCLILVDEWVAYARQLYDQGDLPGGGFETQFSFAQALTESARLARNCLLVISLPASDTATSPHALANSEEVGGIRGQEALARLRNVVGRLESSWTPATAEEGFEIVRRRLFEPMRADHFKLMDATAREFADMYRSQQQEFPPDCRESDYEKRIKAAYPIHPEIFDRLYTDWSTLVKFQRTRGVLRLMAAVIYSLWEKGDRNPLIMPANVPIDDTRVRDELTRYLSDNWKPIIEKDVDGPDSLPLAIDGEVPNLGKFSACRRVARTIYLGSAPITSAANKGVEDRRVKLGCAMPGETIAVFGDALRRLAQRATYLYQDGNRYWYDTQPTVTKLADDRAEQYRRSPDKIAQEIERRLRADLARRGDFPRIHPLPGSSADVPDDTDARLVVLGIDCPYCKERNCAAEQAAVTILENRGNTPRLFRNTLIFLAPDKQRLQDLDESLRKFLAWESILAEKDALDLRPHQVKQAEAQLKTADGTINARLPETFQWLLVPGQSKPQAPVTWEAIRLSGQDALAVRASKKLKSEELLLTSFASSRLRMELDRVPLWRGNHVEVRQLVEDFARYLYLPRLRDSSVLLQAIDTGTALLTWEKDAFAYADSYDEDAGRYRGLRWAQMVSLTDAGASGLLVKPEIAKQQMEDEGGKQPEEEEEKGEEGAITGGEPPEGDDEGGGGPKPPKQTQPKRFHGTVDLDPTRVGRDAGRIAEEVIAHFAGLVGASVKVTLEIEAEIPHGAPDHVVRTVTENSRTLNFTNQGFEKE
ncbi:MAG TPA: ATP-binding protein [Desulfobacteraceae bacterium]|nr:ATP-binding protein [Desulfobacteraceae bacterium]